MERINYFDYLRILAALSVVFIHVSAVCYAQEGCVHLISSFWDGLCRWGVTIFVMISGTIFLEPTKNITIKNIFTKYILRMLIIFYVWSFFYACFLSYCYNNYSLHFFCNRFIHGEFHQWFLFLIIVLYFVSLYARPFIEKKDRNLIILFLIIWFIVSNVVPFIIYFYPWLKPYLSCINKNNIYVGYFGCFILGYYLHNFVNIKNRFYMFLLLIISLLATSIGDMIYSTPTEGTIFFGHFQPFILFASISIFLLLKSYSDKLPKNNKIILKLSRLTLGVYLIHPAYIRIFKKLHLFDKLELFLHDNYFFTIPIMSMLLTILSFATIFILSKNKIINKYCL